MLILKGILIGMVVVIPIGPIGLLTIQRTINRGWKAGFLSGVGAAASDLIYASLAVFGMGFIDDAIHRHRCLINITTGILFLVVGIGILISTKKTPDIPEETKEQMMHPALSSFLMGFSNPMTFFIFLAVFAKFRINLSDESIVQSIMLVISIFTGSSLFWLLTSNAIRLSKTKLNPKVFTVIDKIIGIVIILFGVFSILKGISKF